MNRYSSILLLILGIGHLLSAQLLNLEEFAEPDNKEGAIVFVDDFENASKWSLPQCFRIEEGSGRSLTKALSFERKSLLNEYKIARIPLLLKPEKRYKLTFSYRLKNVAPKKNTSIMTVDFLAVEFSRNGKYQSGKYHPVPFLSETTQWAQSSFEFDNPPDTTPNLSFYLNRHLIGKIYIDDIVIQETGHAPPLIYPLVPKNLRFPIAGKFKFHIDAAGIPEHFGLLSASLNGLVKTAPIRQMVAELDFSDNLRTDSNAVTMETMVLDLKEKTIRGRESFKFYKSEEDAPLNAVEILSSGKISMKEGKFLPVGVFTSRLTDADIKNIAAAGFNCILRYAPLTASRHPSWHINSGEDKSAVGLLQRMFNLLEEHNLKLIFSLYEQRGGKQAADKLGPVEGIDAVTQYAVNLFKKHPALLAWYISDENPISEVPRLLEMRNLISAGDPFHPTITLTHRSEDYKIFGKTGDIFMIDQYPIQDDESRSMAEIRRHIAQARQNHLPLWMAIQSFNWGAYRSADFNSYRYPTEMEMRSMALLGLNNGATGILFYSYSSIFELQEKHDPGSSENFWQNLVAAASPIRQFENFFLSDEQPPELKVSVISGTVEAKAYCYKGKNILVITGDGPGTSKAEIFFSGEVEMQSEYGLTKNAGKGKYLFFGQDICSDIIY